MKKTLVLLTTITSLWVSAAGADIKIANAYIKPTNTTERPTVAYFTLTNTDKTDDTLLSVTTDIAKMVQIHETSINENGVMSMNHLTKGIKIPAGKSIALKPKGTHLMLMGLSKPLALNDTISFTFIFERTGTQVISLDVKE